MSLVVVTCRATLLRGRSHSMDDIGKITAPDAYDLMMGLSRMTGSEMIADIAKVVGDLNPPVFTHALNAKQIASKQWLLLEMLNNLGSVFSNILVVGGWYGVLSALLLNDPRFVIGRISSVDLDPSCAPVAELLNRRFMRDGRFSAHTSDMYRFDYGSMSGDAGSLVINTSCEHIPNLRDWLALLPRGQQVVLQSNDYHAIPEHIACVSSADELATLAGLSTVSFSGALPSKNYTRFMVMGRV